MTRLGLRNGVGQQPTSDSPNCGTEIPAYLPTRKPLSHCDRTCPSKNASRDPNDTDRANLDHATGILSRTSVEVLVGALNVYDGRFSRVVWHHFDSKCVAPPAVFGSFQVSHPQTRFFDSCRIAGINTPMSRLPRRSRGMALMSKPKGHQH